MARQTPVRTALRSLIWLGVIVVGLVGLNLFNAFTVAVPKGTPAAAVWAPKLDLDLAGGTQIILQPELANKQTVSSDQLDQAVAIIRERIDAAGVSEPDITTQGSGGNENVVVSIPGTLDNQTLTRITKAAKLSFRPVLLTSAATNSTSGASTATPGSTPSPTPSLESTPTSRPTNGSDLAYVTPALQADFASFSCSSDAAKTANLAPSSKPLVTCDPSGTEKFVLGPVELSGSDITNATNGQVQSPSGANTGEWAVNMSFNSSGGAKFQAISTRLIALTAPRNQFAIVLDGQVIQAPTVKGITNSPQITGAYTQVTSKTLADQLKFGALPISFKPQSVNHISATLGSSSLAGGLLAGLIGLILVVIYSLLQYRLLGILTIASLVVAAVITYLFITYLSWTQGYRLSLAGVAGLIVAIGITADSFIVYFERVRDELRDGRGLESAVDAGWRRALRTILASDAINILAAVILYLLAIGSVRGFALTLGLTTIFDVIIVTLFTHPMMQLIARRRFFAEGHRLSGLDPRALGAVYRGRAQFRPVVSNPAKLASSSREAARRQTIAERKAAEANAAREGKDL